MPPGPARSIAASAAAGELLLLDRSAFLRLLRPFVVTDNALQGANIEGRTLFAGCHQRDRTERHDASPVCYLPHENHQRLA